MAWKLQLLKSVFHREQHLQNQTPPLPFLGYEQVLGVLARPLLQYSFYAYEKKKEKKRGEKKKKSAFFWKFCKYFMSSLSFFFLFF